MSVRWAFAGAGRHAELWMIPAVAAAANAELTGVWGQHVDKAQALARRYGIARVYPSLDALVGDRDVDAVYVSTPNSLHAAHALAALQSGKHVLCEKPMATSVTDAHRMVDTARDSGLLLGLGFMLRHHLLVSEARERIQRGQIGDVLYASAQFNLSSSPPPRLDIPHSSWKSDPEQMGGAGALMGLGVHIIDALRFLVDSEVHAVSAQASGQTPERPLESFAQVLLEFEGGAQGHLVYGGRFPLSKNDIWIYGSRGRIGLSDVVDVRTLGTLEWAAPDGQDGWTAERHSAQLVDHYQREFEAFSRSIETGSPFEASGLDGLRSVEVTQAIIEAQRSGARVSVSRSPSVVA